MRRTFHTNWEVNGGGVTGDNKQLNNWLVNESGNRNGIVWPRNSQKHTQVIIAVACCFYCQPIALVSESLNNQMMPCCPRRFYILNTQPNTIPPGELWWNIIPPELCIGIFGGTKNVCVKYQQLIVIFKILVVVKIPHGFSCMPSSHRDGRSNMSTLTAESEETEKDIPTYTCT